MNKNTIFKLFPNKNNPVINNLVLHRSYVHRSEFMIFHEKIFNYQIL